MSFDLQLAGKRALVTGGTKGIGAATVAMLSRANAQVVVAARSQTSQGIGGVLYLAANLSTEEGTRAAAESGPARFQWNVP
jgi:NAD(P)-dependent dehydrogenase (short-subunit alcohol dehydrogenase family)